MTTRRRPTQAPRGFSLIELMVAVAIVAILVAIAVPAYSNYVLQSHRTDAIRTLASYRQSLERCYSLNFTYVNAGATPCPSAPGAAVNSVNSYYAVTFPTLTASAYTILATAQGNQTKDTACATMQVTNTGTQTAFTAGGVLNTQTCWGGN